MNEQPELTLAVLASLAYWMAGTAVKNSHTPGRWRKLGLWLGGGLLLLSYALAGTSLYLALGQLL